MSVQDFILGGGGFVFAASLVPTIRSKRAVVPLWTSLPTALILASYVWAEWTVGLHLAAWSGVASSSAWFAIALLRRPRKAKLFPLVPRRVRVVPNRHQP